MATIVLLNLEDRIHDIEVTTGGDLLKYKVSDFEIKVFESLKKLSWGSTKQLNILSTIEKKVFGCERNNVEKKETLRLGSI